MLARRQAGAHFQMTGSLTLQMGSSCAPTNSSRYSVLVKVLPILENQGAYIYIVSIRLQAQEKIIVHV